MADFPPSTPLVREHCPGCSTSHTTHPLDFVDVLVAGASIHRRYWCPRCGWRQDLEFKTPDTVPGLVETDWDEGWETDDDE